MTLATFILAALAYGAASFAYGVEEEQRRGARTLLAVAAALHLACIGALCLEGEHPFKSVFLAASLGGFFAVSSYLVFLRGTPASLGALMSPVGLAGVVLGVLFSGQDATPLPGSHAIAKVHLGFATAGLAGFTLAAGLAAVYLVMEHRLRQKSFRPGQGGMSLTAVDRLHHRVVLLVTPVFTLAIVTGVLWIFQLGGPGMLRGRMFEVVASVFAWAASIAVLLARAAFGTRGRQSAWLTVASFVSVVLVMGFYGVRS